MARVTVTEIEQNVFAELEAEKFQDEIDPSDRKFIAVAFSSRNLDSEILQATDSEWLLWLDHLRASGVRVRFLCPAEIVNYFQRKYPGAPVPALSGAD